MKTNRVWGMSWLPHLQKVQAVHCFQVPQLNTGNISMGHWRAIHLPCPNRSIRTHQMDLVHVFQKQQMISSCWLGPSWTEMCTKRDRVKLINSGTLSVDFINIDACAATLFGAFFYSLQSREGQSNRLVFMYSHRRSKQARKHMHSSSYVMINTDHTSVLQICNSLADNVTDSDEKCGIKYEIWNVNRKRVL